MSQARARFHSEVDDLSAAVSLAHISQGAGSVPYQGVSILRRGAAITALVILEAFIRDRTEETLGEFSAWPAKFEDLPQKFRNKVTIEAVTNIDKFAKMLRRQNQDYEPLIIQEAGKIASMAPPSFSFTKFFAGDYTGNISDSTIKEILSAFQVSDCWCSFRHFTTDIGFTVPSVEQILRSVVRDRHRSAHIPGHSPTASDISELPLRLRLVGICFDVSLTSSLRLALHQWAKWSAAPVNWRSSIDIFFVDEVRGRLKLHKRGSSRALRIVADLDAARLALPAPRRNKLQLMVQRNADRSPRVWHIN